MKNKKRSSLFSNFFLLLISVLLFALENPNIIYPTGFGFLAWISYIPVLFLIRNVSVKKSILYGFLFGFIGYFLFAYWLFNYSPFGLLGILVLYSVIYAVLFIVLKYADTKFIKNGWLVQWVLVCAFEYIRTKGFAGFNYGVTGYTQWQYLKLIQIVDVIGVFGFTAFLIFPSFLFYAYLKKYLDKKNITTSRDTDNELYECTTHINYISKYELQLKSTSVVLPIIFTVLWVASCVYVVYYGIKTYDVEKSEKTITMVAIQHNENPDENSLKAYRENILTLMELTDEALEMNPSIQMVVWPETAVVPAIVYNYDNKNDSERSKLVNNLLNYIDSHDITFVIGNGHIIKKQGEKEYYNSALVFTGKENVLPPKPDLYFKNHLVPLTEYFPFINYFDKANDFLVDHGFALWLPGKELKVFEKKDLSFSTPICFEDTFPDICREMYKKGSRCFINLSNDSWSKSLACEYQHLSMAVFRSIENKIPSVRSTASGITCFVDSYGNIKKSAEPFCKTYITGEVVVIDKNREGTIYSTYGDVFPLAFIILGISLLIIRIIVDIIKYRKEQLQEKSWQIETK